MPVARPHKVKIVAVGDDLGLELPQEVIDRYQLQEDDDISLSWKDGEMILSFKPTDAASDSAPRAKKP